MRQLWQEQIIGIAMGLAGTDAAVETADLTLVHDQPELIPYALALSRATMANLKQTSSLPW